MLVNIIIPIKNTSIGYFEDCLYSLMTQIDKNFIVTVIDDGSYIENTQQYINLLKKDNETPQTFMEWRKEMEKKAYGN